MNDEVQKKEEDDNLGSFYMGRTKIRQENSSKRRLPPGLLTFIILLLFAGIIWYAYPRGEQKYSDIDVPVVQADTAEIKVMPTEPSGMEVPHQDSALFNALDSGKAPVVENILPMDEKPVNKEEMIAKTEEVVSGFIDAPRTAQVPQFKPIIKDIKSTPKEVIKPQKRAEEKVSATSMAVIKDTYVQLGSYREISDAEKDWIRIKKKYPNILSGLEMKAVRVDLKAKGVFHRLHAGKLSKEDAVKTCEAIKAAKGGCLVVKN